MTEERRKSSRRKALKGARIIFNNGRGSVVCTVRNISDSGAKLHVESVLDVPSEFKLMFDDGSPSRQCFVKWRDSATLGVEFK
jgi:methyl-accepting chemotaxis protein